MGIGNQLADIEDAISAKIQAQCAVTVQPDHHRFEFLWAATQACDENMVFRQSQVLQQQFLLDQCMGSNVPLALTKRQIRLPFGIQFPKVTG
ncbi:hypothetical protein D3C80_1756490 [compost metagenome]